MQDRSSGAQVLLTDLTTHVDEWMVANGSRPASRVTATRALERFARFAAAHGVNDAREVTTELVESFVHAVGPGGGAPALSSMHNRRAMIRLAYRLYHQRDASIIDPTYGLVLPPRVVDAVRPLTDDEVDLLRAVSVSTLTVTVQPTIVALAEAGAITTEIALVTDADVDEARVRLAGTAHAFERTVELTQWGAAQVSRALAVRGEGPLVYRGEGHGNSGQATVSVILRRMFNRAGLTAEPDLGLNSVRAWAGRNAFDESGRIEDAARVLGCRGLDAAARMIGWSWR